jgi:hypothetical protein
LEEAVTNNVWALIVVTLAAILLAMALLFPSRRDDGRTRVLWASLWAFLGVAIVGTLAFIIWPDGFRANAHVWAAFGTFFGILAVVATNAIHLGIKPVGLVTAGVGNPPPEPLPPRQAMARRLYALIFMVMVLTMVVIGLLYWLVSDWRHGVLWIEAALMLEFLVFWVVQTYELWPTTRRFAPPVPMH